MKGVISSPKAAAYTADGRPLFTYEGELKYYTQLWDDTFNASLTAVAIVSRPTTMQELIEMARSLTDLARGPRP